jgi:hypothetical protein
MRYVGFAICLAAVSTPAAAQEATVGTFQVVEAGIYTRDIISSSVDAQGVRQNVISNPKLALSTTRIPLKLGVSFGFMFKVSGTPDGAVITVRKETHYPAPGARPPGSSAPLLVNTGATRVALNTVRYSGYTLAEPWELIPGKWIFSFWLGDRKLGEQEFTLVAE